MVAPRLRGSWRLARVGKIAGHALAVELVLVVILYVWLIGFTDWSFVENFE